ncbi:hypothetical protein NRB56_44580 [Nocardia sp. RB56]|uniref:Nucleotidyl transferase AbiEii/AbiGii toxin family protein n=1 Tax=Nocardia aurantia TaxID=2585199 RepID=A0A7K0DSX5_9NOCA|nr:hypothetical protein [Nocardia aurantia]
MFDRAHHRRIATVLQALDGDLLAANGCLFGGGTAIALRYGEYRESVDVDFLVSDNDGYRVLREKVTGAAGISAITRRNAELPADRPVRADRYGIRTAVRVDGITIKLEIIAEGRIALETPGDDDRVCGLAALTPLDMAATKLLANSDRWPDDAVFSRDIIDLAMMTPDRQLLRRAIDKTRIAYGDAIERDLTKAVRALRDRPGRLDQCMRAMEITTVPKALLWKRIRALAA